jgi:hypothetical protein
MRGLGGFDSSRLIQVQNADIIKLPAFWISDSEGWFKVLFRMAFYMSSQGLNTDPSGAAAIFQRASNPDAGWERAHRLGGLSVSQLRDIKAMLLENPSSYASLVLLSPIGFFLAALAVSAFIQESNNPSLSARGAAAFLLNSMLEQLCRGQTIFSVPRNKSMGLNIVNLLSSQGYNNRQLLAAASDFIRLGGASYSMPLLDYEASKRLIGEAVMGTAAVKLDDVYLLSSRSNASVVPPAVPVTVPVTVPAPVAVDPQTNTIVGVGQEKNAEAADASLPTAPRSENQPAVVPPAGSNQSGKLYATNVAVAVVLVGLMYYYFSNKNKKR